MKIKFVSHIIISKNCGQGVERNHLKMCSIVWKVLFNINMLSINAKEKQASWTKIPRYCTAQEIQNIYATVNQLATTLPSIFGNIFPKKERKKKIITSALPVTLWINAKVKFILLDSYFSWDTFWGVLEYRIWEKSVFSEFLKTGYGMQLEQYSFLGIQNSRYPSCVSKASFALVSLRILI